MQTTMKTEMTRAEASRLWTQGNNAGDGFDPIEELAGAEVEDTLEAAVAALVADGWTLVHAARHDDEIAVLELAGRVIGVGESHGAWAVELARD